MIFNKRVVIFLKKHYRPQLDTRDCGIACLAMILSYYGSHYSLASLRERAKTTQEGTTAFGLIKVAQEEKFETRAIQADMTLFDEDITYPFIAHVLKDNKFMHYYVIIGCNDKNIYVADPDPNIRVTKISYNQFEKEWTGISLFIAPSFDYEIHKEENRSFLSFIIFFLKEQKTLIIKITIATIFITLFNILGALYLQRIIDIYIPRMDRYTLSLMSCGLISIYIFQLLISYIQAYLLLILGKKLSISINLTYIKHIFQLPMSFFTTRRTGDIVSRFNDIVSIIDALVSIIFNTFIDTLTVIIVYIFLFYQNKILFFISVLALPIYCAIIWSFVKFFDKLNYEIMESNATLSSSIIETINGIETVKALTSENKCYQKIDREFSIYMERTFVYGKAENLQKILKISVKLFLNVAILWVGGFLVMDNKMSIGQLFTYNLLLVYFTTSLENIIHLQPKLQRAKVANDRLNEVYVIKPELSEQKDIITLENIKGEYTFRNVNYQYVYGRDILTDINLVIPYGSKISFVGSSGSGKTTLAKMMVNFLKPLKGVITLDDIDLEKIDKGLLRQSVTYLPQQPYIFNGTILENLLLGVNRNVTQKEIIKAVEIAEIRSEIESMTFSYQTILRSSDSSGLSGGQKQRIALARALLTDASVLILDEATSNLDILTEKKIIDNLMKIEKTIVFIVHRLSIAKRTDKIVVLDNGRIIEYGSHAELIRNNGLYAHLINN